VTVTEKTVKETIVTEVIVETEAVELNVKNPAVMIAIVVNQIGNQEEIDQDREVKTKKEQNEADQENEEDRRTEKKENEDLEVEIEKIKSDEADHVIENPKRLLRNRKKKDAKNRSRRAAKKKIENLPSPAILTRNTLNCHFIRQIYNII